MANYARITNRAIAVTATATARASNVHIALNAIILSVSLVLLLGAVWMHVP